VNMPSFTGRSLLAVFAHPDDESIACGGLLALCADRGVRVALLCATHGENRGGVRDEGWFVQRARELDDAARILGTSEVVLLDYRDGFLPWAADLSDRIEQEIRRLSTSETVTALVPAGQTVGQAWEASESMEWKRSLLRLVISKIIVNPGRAKPFYVVKGKRMRFSPDLVDVVWRA